MSRNEQKIRNALKSIGYEAREVRWEPLGPNYEMCGRSGGWIVDDVHPIGLNILQAMDFIARYPECFRRERSSGV